MRKVSILLTLLLLFSSFTGKKGKGDLFCDASMHPKGTTYSVKDLLEYSSFIKVGQTYTFGSTNYLDKLSMPLKERKVTLKITFNNNNTITLKDNLGNQNTFSVLCAYASEMFVRNKKGERIGNYYEIDFKLDGAFLRMFRQLPNSNYGRNKYGMCFNSDDYNYYTGPANSVTLQPFNY